MIQPEDDGCQYALENTFLIELFDHCMKCNINGNEVEESNKQFPDSGEDKVLTEDNFYLQIASSEFQENRYSIKKELDRCVVPARMGEFDCNIDKFLEEIPDPIAEFSSENYSRVGYEKNAEIYLHSRYQDLDPEKLKSYLDANSYDISVVTAGLEAEGFVPEPYCLDKINLHHPPSIFFHQEVWFIEHRSEVLELLDKRVKDIQPQSNEPVLCSSVREVFECKICSEEIVEYSQLSSCDSPAGHLFCNTCIKRSIEIEIGRGSTTFPCLAKCGGFIDLQTIEKLLSIKKFAILMNKIQEREIVAANIAGVESCPFCHYAYEPDEEDLFTCLNPDCMKISCRACKKEDHSPEICPINENEDEETARHYIENIMSRALIRQCYKCGKNYIKKDGCNKITCICGAIMCYLCHQPVTGYSHFNGQGGENFDRCELFSDDVTVHEEPVAKSALEAINQLKAKNPGMKLDARKIIPK